MIILGSPASAVKLTASALVSSRAQIMATTGAMHIISQPHIQPAIIRNVNEWTLKPGLKLATSDSDAVLGSVNGIFRVDIGEGSHFICDPKSLVGSHGKVNASIVHAEQRTDIGLQMFRKFWDTTQKLLKPVSWTVSRTMAFISPHIRKLAAQLAAKLGLNMPSLSPYTARIKMHAQRLFKSSSAYIFHATHKPKLRVCGPCSLLIRV